MKVSVVALLLAAGFMTGGALYAAEPATAPGEKPAAVQFSERHLALARELVTMVNPRGPADTQLRILAQEMRSNPQTSGYGDLFREWVADTAHTEALAEDVARMYAEHFSPEELKDILRFYKSDTGKKVIAAMPILAEKSIRLGEEWAIREAPSLVEKIRQRMQEEDARATESMAVPAPGGRSY